MILEGLYKLRIRESEKLKIVLDLYDLETHQKKLGPDYHRLKTIVSGNYKKARSGNFEKNAVVKNQGTKHVQRILGDCWQWETNGQCVKGNNCTFRHYMNKRGKSSPLNPSQNSFMQQNERKPSRTLVECLVGLARITLEELAISHVVKNGTLQNACTTRPRVVCRFGEKCSFAHRQVDEQPTKRSKSNNDKSAVAMLKHGNWQERESVSDACHDRTGKPVRRSDKKLGQNSSKRQFSDARQLGCVF